MLQKKNYSKILINNQILYSDNCNESLLLINKEIFYQNYQILNNIKLNNDIIKQNKFLLIKIINKFDYINNIILLIFVFIKVKFIIKIIESELLMNKKEQFFFKIK